MSLAKDIASLRKRTGLTQQELAQRSGLGLKFIRKVEQGGLNFRYDKLNQLLDFFGCHLEIHKSAPVNKILDYGAKFAAVISQVDTLTDKQKMDLHEIVRERIGRFKI